MSIRSGALNLVMRSSRAVWQSSAAIFSNLRLRFAEPRRHWGQLLPRSGSGQTTQTSVDSLSAFFLAIRRLARAVLDPYRSAHKAESRADLVFQKTLVRKVQLDGAIGEQNEPRRRDRGLRHVINLHPFGDGNRGALEVDAAEEAIHLTGADALAALARDQGEGGEEFVEVLSRRSRDENDWRI